MSHLLNRRATLAGAISIAAAALQIAAQAATPGTNADAELFDLVHRWEKGKALEKSSGVALRAMERLAQANEPPVPPEPLQPIEGLSDTEKPRHARGWLVEELEHFAALTVFSKFTRSKTHVGFDSHFIDQPVPYGVRAKARELLGIKKRYDAAYEAVRKEAETSQKRFDDIVSVNCDIVNQISETPANTLQGLLAKCRVCQVEGLFVNFCDYSDFAQSMVEDIERLAPQFTVGL